MTTTNTYLPTSLLLNYREFDRVKKPAPRIPFCQGETVESLTEAIKKEGITSSLELSICGDLALLTDGNHRICSISQLGYSECPINIVRYDSMAELESVFYVQTINRMKKIGNSLMAELN